MVNEVISMSEPNEQAYEIGKRLEALRKARGLSRERLAQIAEVSPSLIKFVEAGKRNLTLDKARRLAPILGVDNMSAFYGESVNLALEARASHPDVPAVRQALTAWQVKLDGEPQSADYLRGMVDHAWRSWHTSENQRTEAGQNLPTMLRIAERSARLVPDEERRLILPMLAQVYHYAQAYLAWHGERELVYLTVDRGMQTALDSASPLAIGSSVFYAAHVLRSVGRAEEALENLADARDLLIRHEPAVQHSPHEDPELEPTEWVAMLIDLWRCSALTRARNGDQGAWSDWAQADALVGRLPDGFIHPWTQTSRTIVDVEAVMIAADLGDADEMRRRSAHIDPSQIPSTERRARHWVELARGVSLEGSLEGTLHLLTQAASVSVESVAFTPAARELAEKLVKSSGATLRRDAEELALRLGIEL